MTAHRVLCSMVRLAPGLAAPATIRAISGDVGISLFTVQRALVLLEAQGLAYRLNETARAGASIRWHVSPAGRDAALLGTRTCSSTMPGRCVDPGQWVACVGATA